MAYEGIISGVRSVAGDASGQPMAWGAGSPQESLGAPCQQELRCSGSAGSSCALPCCQQKPS